MERDPVSKTNKLYVGVARFVPVGLCPPIPEVQTVLSSLTEMLGSNLDPF